jgi:mannitol/fructose-specific phosphotransferase system IIA component (Ntr-type)
MAPLKMLTFLRPSCVALPLKAEDKLGAIEELLGLLEKEGLLADPEMVRRDVLAREKQLSTGLTEGLAIPHAKSAGARDLAMALGLKPEGIQFTSLDMEPARAIFLLASPADQTGPYLQCLAEISSFYAQPQAREKLLGAKTVQEVLSAMGSL